MIGAPSDQGTVLFAKEPPWGLCLAVTLCNCLLCCTDAGGRRLLGWGGYGGYNGYNGYNNNNGGAHP